MKVAFLDRDGVINKEIGYLHQISDFEYTEKCVEALSILGEEGFSIVIITNQAGIAKGHFTEKQYHKLTNWYIDDLKNNSISIMQVKYCPHHEQGVIPKYRIKCPCRKPSPGMIDQVLTEFDVDLKSSILVGDKLSDIVAGKSAGVGACYLVRSSETPRDCDAFDSLYSVAIAVAK